MRRGQLYIFSGPSGSGKDTILKIVLEQTEDLKLSISSITRAMREGEVDGEKYHFVSRAEFEQMMKDDALLEYNLYLDQYYGTPKQPVEEYLNQGIDVILEIDVNGAEKVKRKCPEAISIFVLPPSLEVLRARLAGRGTETEEVISRRMQIALNEIGLADQYDYIVINDQLENACKELTSIILSKRCKTEKRNHLLKEFSLC
ncbi:MAG: guanylate kinase [Clostridia bacterium]|nr:guanylate kinase [Clostridia bacterium]MBQ7289070.1 guanylate kinase [Clostridia bacterium]